MNTFDRAPIVAVSRETIVVVVVAHSIPITWATDQARPTPHVVASTPSARSNLTANQAKRKMTEPRYGMCAPK